MPGEPHEQRSLAGYNPQGHKDPIKPTDSTECTLNVSVHTRLPEAHPGPQPRLAGNSTGLRSIWQTRAGPQDPV